MKCLRHRRFSLRVRALKEAAAPSGDNKNGMIAFPTGNVSCSSMIKFASGVFPPITKYADPKLIELVDAVVPEISDKLKKLNFLYVKLAALQSKVQGKNQATRNADEDCRYAFMVIYDTLIASSQYLMANGANQVDLQQAVQKFLGNDIPGSLEVKQLGEQVQFLLSPLFSQYIMALEKYFTDLQIAEPFMFFEQLGEAAKRSKANSNMDIATFKRFIKTPLAEPLRNFSHTEDIILYKRLNGTLPALDSLMFSFNDLCQLCRVKFSNFKPRRDLLPKTITYVSEKKYINTTVDYIYEDQKFYVANEQGHNSIEGVCQIRVPKIEEFVDKDIKFTYKIENMSVVPHLWPNQEKWAEWIE